MCMCVASEYNSGADTKAILISLEEHPNKITKEKLIRIYFMFPQLMIDTKVFTAQHKISIFVCGGR